MDKALRWTHTDERGRTDQIVPIELGGISFPVSSFLLAIHYVLIVKGSWTHSRRDRERLLQNTNKIKSSMLIEYGSIHMFPYSVLVKLRFAKFIQQQTFLN